MLKSEYVLNDDVCLIPRLYGISSSIPKCNGVTRYWEHVSSDVVVNVTAYTIESGA